jgi:hypothetical protein
MPTTITAGFQKLKENLEITTLQSTKVAERQKNVRDAVGREMTVLTDFVTGSYQRSTMIAPLSEADVDVFVVLDAKYYEANGQAALLDKVKRAIEKTYRDTKISRAGQAVTVKFSDFYVDVVPGFYRNGGGYLIPDSPDKRWIETDPTKHVELWADLNRKKSGSFVPLLKMLKQWNRRHSAIFRSFHLETLAYDVLQNVTISDYPSGCRYVFDKARDKLSWLSDPAGYSGNVGTYLDTQQKRDDAKAKLTSAYEKAVDAENLEKNGRTSQAYDKWRIIFGDYFPVYG